MGRKREKSLCRQRGLGMGWWGAFETGSGTRQGPVVEGCHAVKSLQVSVAQQHITEREGGWGGRLGRWAGLGHVARLSAMFKELDFCSSSREKALRVLESDQLCVFKNSLCLEGTRDPWIRGKGKGVGISLPHSR